MDILDVQWSQSTNHKQRVALSYSLEVDTRGMYAPSRSSSFCNKDFAKHYKKDELICITEKEKPAVQICYIFSSLSIHINEALAVKQTWEINKITLTAQGKFALRNCCDK